MSSASKSRFKALVIEPDKHRGILTVDLLRHAPGCEPLALRSIEEAEDHLEVNAPDFIFLAENLGPLNAFEYTKMFRRSQKARDVTRHVILILNHVDRPVLTLAINCGADGVVRWPLSQAAIEGALKSVRQFQRPFVRCPVYVGPCRRRGMAPGVVQSLRLEDLGDSAHLNLALQSFERLCRLIAVNGEAMTDAQKEIAAIPTAEAFTAYLFEACLDYGVDIETLMAKCQALLRLVMGQAAKGASHHDLVARVRKVLSNELRMLREAKADADVSAA
jgi:DNA-binding NarL/FixJ family response regulator